MTSFAGVDADLEWVHRKLETKMLLNKVGTLGGDAADLKEVRVLNRVLRWEAWGIAYEADPRHAELLIRALGPNSPSRGTPGIKPSAGSRGDQDLLPWAAAR